MLKYTFASPSSSNQQEFDHFLKDILVDITGNMLEGKQIHQITIDCFNAYNSYQQTWRAKVYVLDLLRGSPKKTLLIS